MHRAAKRVQNTSVDFLPAELAEVSKHLFRVLVAKINRITKSQIPQIFRQARPNTWERLKLSRFS